MNFSVFAELIGLKGIRLETPDHIGKAWDIALAETRPVVIDAVVDPDVLPLPPHITLRQSKAFLSGVLKEDPRRAGFIRQALRNMFPSIAQRS